MAPWGRYVGHPIDIIKNVIPENGENLVIMIDPKAVDQVRT